ncbi:MAG: hypothetical protein PUF95_01360 [Selenomonadaceae bacterium]|nr:hypothetical protein [Selenomonadaceae bacterium]MDD6396939.1 hypothetical protein [Selenomonadaceae bacterium]
MFSFKRVLGLFLVALMGFSIGASALNVCSASAYRDRQRYQHDSGRQAEPHNSDLDEEDYEDYDDEEEYYDDHMNDDDY